MKSTRIPGKNFEIICIRKEEREEDRGGKDKPYLSNKILKLKLKL